MNKHFNSQKTRNNRINPIKIGVLFITIFFIATAIWSCRKEFNHFTSNTDNLASVKDFYSANKNRENISFNGMEPIWENVKSKTLGNYTIYEVALKNPQNIYINDSANEKSYLAFSKSEIKLVFFEDQKTNTIVNGCFMATSGNRDVRYLSYQNFSGTINFYDLKEKYVNGWIVEKGIVNNKILPNIKRNDLQSNKIATTKNSTLANTTQNSPIVTYSTQCEAVLVDIYSLACVGAGNGYSEMSRIYNDPGYYSGCTPIRTGTDSELKCKFLIEIPQQIPGYPVGFELGGFDGIDINISEKDKEEKKKNCQDEYGSTAYIDSCGTCVGGATGLEPCNLDVVCKLNFGLAAYWSDECKTCIGGTTGKEACPILDTTNKVKDPCIKEALLLALGKDVQSKIKSLMVNTFMQNKSINLEFESYSFNPNGPNAKADAYARAWNGTNTLSQIIAFNEALLPFKSKEYIVATVYHEVLHAYLSNLFPKDQAGKILIPNDHEYMVNNYITLMVNDLRSQFTSLSETDAWALAWGGLEKTSRYSLLSQPTRNTIAQINQQYSTKPGVNQVITSKGSYCP